MSMALQIRVDALSREVGELRQRLAVLEGQEQAKKPWPQPTESAPVSEADDDNAAVEGDDLPRRRGRPRKQP